MHTSVGNKNTLKLINLIKQTMNFTKCLLLALVLAITLTSIASRPARSRKGGRRTKKKKRKRLPPPPTTPAPSRGPAVNIMDVVETPDFEQLIEGVEFLMNFGHVKTSVGFSAEELNVTEVELGIKNVQKFAGLEQSGRIDSSTLFAMRSPRCGERDVDPHQHAPGEVHVDGDENEVGRQKRFTPAGGRYKWDHNQITWTLLNGPGANSRITLIQVKKELKRAFNEWSKYTQLDFIYTDSITADMRFSFGARRHGNDPAFDGPGGVLGHAFAPNSGWKETNGDVHFDDEETFTYRERDGTNLFYVACHEIGHALGLDHSHEVGALMWPYDKGYVPNFQLPIDDIKGIQSIYGVRDGSPTPPPPPPPEPKHGECTHYAIAIISGSLFVFQGADFWRFIGHDVAQRLVTPLHGYPTKRFFNGLPSNLDAAFTKVDSLSGDKHTVFLRGRNIWTFKGREKLPGYPIKLERLYPGVPKSIDAAFHDEQRSITYFFQANVMWKFDEKRGRLMHEAEGLYATDEFEDIPYAPVAAFQDDHGHTYFVSKGLKYFRYTRGSSAIEYGYPKAFPFADCH